MAYQPKSYRKFLVGAVSTAVVASSFAGVAGAAANFTDVNANYKEAVDFLVSKGINGISATEFGVQQNIKRVDAAVFVVKALGLDVDKAPASGFTDVPARAEKEVNALKEAGITAGKSATEFGAQDLITRGELAIWLTKAFDLKGEGDVSALTDANGIYTDAIKALVANNITKGTSATTFGTKDNAKRGDFAIFVKRAADATAELAVTGVSATNATTLTVTGTGLNKLKASDITVADNTVSSVTATADGKSATVKVGAAFVPDTEYKVTVQSKEFTIKYNLEAKTVAVDSKSYDNDTTNQFVSFQVNGATVSVNDLLVNGYTVKFAAVDKDGKDATATLFGVNTTTGELKTGLTVGSVYKVQLTISKGSEVIVSPQAEITIKNLELVASAINSYELTNTNAAVVQKSSILVPSESIDLTEVKAVQNSSETTLNAADVKTAITAGTMEVKSSNPAVVSVNKERLTANTPGTATITITYGTATKTIDITVAKAARELTKVVSEKTSVPVILTTPAAATNVKLTAIDQYGDYLNTDQLASEAITVESSSTSIATVPGTVETTTDGKVQLAITPVKVGTVSITFKNAKGTTVGSTSALVTDIGGVSTKQLEIKKPTTAEKAAGQSEDATIDKADDNYVIFNLQQYTAENVKNGLADLAGYRVVYNKDIVSIGGVDSNDGDAKINAAVAPALTVDDLKITAVKAGYSDIALYDKENKFVGQVRVTVEDNTPEISAVSFKSVPEVTYAGKKIDYTTVLDTVESANDDIVKGITLTKSTGSSIRIEEAAGADLGKLYIDKDGDGSLDVGETVLGTLKVSVASGQTGLAGFTTINGSTSAAADKGTIIFKVENTKTPVEIVASTSISVNVPK